VANLGKGSRNPPTRKAMSNDIFQWIDRGSLTSPAPTKWPARSPDLTTCDNSLWEYKKDIVSKQRYHSNDQLKAAVTAAFETITPALLRKMYHRTLRHIILCIENEGEHTDILDTSHKIHEWVGTFGPPCILKKIEIRFRDVMRFFMHR